ncbi:MAG: L,D-transpeptidase family protein, partial [Hafnia alvei]
VKVSVEPDGKRYVEVHQPLSRTEKDDPQTMHIALKPAAKKFADSQLTDRLVFDEAVKRRSGMPVIVNHGQEVKSEPETNAVKITQAKATSTSVTE